MYKHVKNRTKYGNSCRPSVPVSEFECDHEYKPFGYYVLGGSDPTGEHTDLSAETFGEDPAYLAGTDLQPDAMCDPRTNAMDVIEQIGYESAMAAAAEIESGKKEKK